MVEEISYNWLVWQYEAVCLNCGRRLFLPDGESCLYCGGDELRVLGQATYELTMHAGTGDITVKKDCTWLTKGEEPSHDEYAGKDAPALL